VIEGVEEFRTELKIALLLAQRETLKHGEIKIVGRRADDDIAAGGAIAADEVIRKTGDVEPFPRVVREGVWIANRVGARAGLLAESCRPVVGSRGLPD
jgi:hypothetical protein